MIAYRRHTDLRFWGDNDGGVSAGGYYLTADKRALRRKCSNDDKERDSSDCRQRITCHDAFHKRCRRWQSWCCASSTCNYALLVVIYVCCYLMTRTSPILAADVVAVAPIDNTIINTNDINVFKNNKNNVTVVNDIVNNNNYNNTKRPTTTTQMAVKLKSIQQGLQSADAGSSTGDVGTSADEDDYYFDDKDDLEYHLLITNKSGRYYFYISVYLIIYGLNSRFRLNCTEYLVRKNNTATKYLNTYTENLSYHLNFCFFD